MRRLRYELGQDLAMSDDVYDFTPRVVHQYMVGRSLANLIFYHDGTSEERAAIRMTCRLIAKRLSSDQLEGIIQYAQIDLTNTLIPTKSWLLNLQKNPKPRPDGPTFVVASLGNDQDDAYDDILTAGNHLPEARPWNPDKSRYSLRERVRIALIHLATRF
jgi:hypothetical protein